MTYLVSDDWTFTERPQKWVIIRYGGSVDFLHGDCLRKSGDWMLRAIYRECSDYMSAREAMAQLRSCVDAKELVGSIYIRSGGKNVRID